MFKDSSVLITGANGLIGSCIVDVIMKLNERYEYNALVYAMCRNIEKAKERFHYYEGNKNFTIIEADVTESFVENIQCEYIIHAASNAHPIAYATQPVETMKANLLGTIHLMEYARICNAKRVMFLSSSEIYGENKLGKREFCEEDCGYLNSMSQRACYPESKRAAEALCVSYDKQYDIETVVARLGYIYGISANENNSRADIQFMQRAEMGQDIILKSDGRQQRSYCYLADAVCGIFYILLLGNRKEAYNVSNDHSSASVRDFAYLLANIAGVNVIFENPTDREQQGFSKVQNSILNSEKLQKLGWKPKINLEEGVARLLKGRKQLKEEV